ncbi:hypothetical protein [Parageobacillus thermoglucosidasius]|uniref:Uncharacterized protein n=1 Tax=Parageobacillus thermoglucosidasius TaxID=1426 RepID=A0AB38QZE1_PARTM|nr:hypothetical protein [Parageobacillus thermoglucosidasius]UOE75819.1 hypothetical protein IMI45_16145 [Parageobacillus thermoglucosidasius]
MIVRKKMKIVSLVFLLVMVFCFPLGGTDQAEATAPDGFVIHADKVVGTLDLGGIIIGVPGGLIGELPIAFLQAKIYGLTLTKLVRTGHGTMVLTIKSNDIVHVNFMNARVTGLDIGGLCFDGIPIIEQCLKDVTLSAVNLTTNNIQIPNMSVETSFDPEEVSQVQSLAESLSQQDLEKEVENLILAIHELENGKEGNEIETFKEVQKDIPKLQEQADQIAILINEAEQQRQQAENQADHLEKEINQGKELIGKPDELKEAVQTLGKQQKDLTIHMERFTVTLQKADEFLQEAKESLEAKEKVVKRVSEILKKWKLAESSGIGKEVADTKRKLHAIGEKVWKSYEIIDKLKIQKQTLNDRIDQMNGSIETLIQNIDKQREQNEEKVLPEKPDNGNESTSTSIESSEGTTETMDLTD